MSLLDKLANAFSAASKEILKPDSFVKGEAFESYVRNVVFPKDNYKLINRAHNYQTNKEDYVESSMNPDFEFLCLDRNKKFHVEVKFRSGVYNYEDRIEWCKPFQLKRYKEIDKRQKVFLVLGIGDDPKRPWEVFIIPMSGIHYCEFYDSFLDKYKFYAGKPVFSSYLWALR